MNIVLYILSFRGGILSLRLCPTLARFVVAGDIRLILRFSVIGVHVSLDFSLVL
jgi:hypothetical protein